MIEKNLFLPDTITGQKVEDDRSMVQIGFKIRLDGSIREKDYFVTKIDSKGKPRYKEELDRFDNIWAQYLNNKEELNSLGDNRHIFLLTKGKRIEGIGGKRHLSGWINSDVLMIKNKESGNLNFLYSFDSRGAHVFTIKINKNGYEGYYCVGNDIDILDYNARIDLNLLHNADQLRKRVSEGLSSK